MASNLGDALYAVALPWYVLANHGGTVTLGVVLAIYGVARTALLAVGGHVSDRFRPWTVMMLADMGRAAAVTALALVAALGTAQWEVLAPIALVLGAGEGLFLPASFAIVPALLTDDDLQPGNALAFSTTQLAMLAGPALGGLVVGLLDPWVGFAIDAASFVCSTATLRGVRRRASSGPDPAVSHGARSDVHNPAANQRPTLRQLVADKPVLVLVLGIDVVANLGMSGMGRIALPALARTTLHSGATGYGVLVASLGGGLLVGSLLAGQVRSSVRPAVISSLAFIGVAAFMASVPYLGGTGGAAAALVMLGILEGFGNVVSSTAFQRWAPRELMGRLMGLMMLASMGILPISVLLASLLVDALGPGPFFLIAAVTLAGAVTIALTRPGWRDFGAVPRDV